MFDPVLQLQSFQILAVTNPRWIPLAASVGSLQPFARLALLSCLVRAGLPLDCEADTGYVQWRRCRIGELIRCQWLFAVITRSVMATCLSAIITRSVMATFVMGTFVMGTWLS